MLINFIPMGLCVFSNIYKTVAATWNVCFISKISTNFAIYKEKQRGTYHASAKFCPTIASIAQKSLGKLHCQLQNQDLSIPLSPRLENSTLEILEIPVTKAPFKLSLTEYFICIFFEVGTLSFGSKAPFSCLQFRKFSLR